MRPQKVDDQQLMAGLMRVLRAKGFDGASMNDLAEATGLKKASLYHRFPGGKKEITDAVLAYTRAWGEENIYQLLHNQELKPEERLTTVLDNIRLLYNDGDSICLLRALTTDSSLPIFGLQIQANFDVWKRSFVQLGKDFGFDDKKSEALAMKSLILVQGSLVLSKALNDLSPFQNSLFELEQNYLS